MIMFGGSHGNRESIDNLSESAVGRMFSIYARGVGGGQEAVEGRSIADEAGGGLQFFERLPLVPAVHEQRLGLLTTRAEVQSAGSTQLSTLRSKQAFLRRFIGGICGACASWRSTLFQKVRREEGFGTSSVAVTIVFYVFLVVLNKSSVCSSTSHRYVQSWTTQAQGPIAP